MFSKISAVVCRGSIVYSLLIGVIALYPLSQWSIMVCGGTMQHRLRYKLHRHSLWRSKHRG